LAYAEDAVRDMRRVFTGWRFQHSLTEDQCDLRDGLYNQAICAIREALSHGGDIGYLESELRFYWPRSPGDISPVGYDPRYPDRVIINVYPEVFPDTHWRASFSMVPPNGFEAAPGQLIDRPVSQGFEVYYFRPGPVPAV
jgi:hypothetical protein